MSTLTCLLTILVLAGTAISDDCVVSDFNLVGQAVENCNKIYIADMTVPAETTLELNLKKGTLLTFRGTTTFTAGGEWAGPMIKVTGDNIVVKAEKGHLLHGQGEKYWDSLGDGGTLKPKFFWIEATGISVFNNVQLKNCPKHCVTIKNSDHITLDGWNIDNRDGDINPDALGKNTDGFDISNSTYVTIQNANVYNQDDCVAVNQGHHMTFYRMYCSGSHGLSLSVGMSQEDGEENTVSDINFLYSVVVNSDNGIHIKTHSDGGKGQISDVTYSNIRLSDIRNYGINIQEDYEQGHSTGTAKGNIPIKNLVFDNIFGEVLSGALQVYIFCGEGGCDDWDWGSVYLEGGKGNQCNFIPEGYSC